MFSHAHNFKITNSTFTHTSSQDAVSTVLFHHVAPGAIFDSLDRFPPGKCHPGTRKRMIKKINDWIHDPSPAYNVLWLYGPAGSGKSALAHSIAELLRQLHSERYGGSFFFARGSMERGRGDRLFATLAYQLALQIPPMRKALNDVLAHDPTIATKSIEYQLEQLIIAPLLQCSKEWPVHALTVFIDGLDECGEGDEGLDTQSAILALIADTVIKHRLPIRFFIASRPEYWIRDSFEIGAMKSLAYHISLRDDVDTDRDMKKYLEDSFEEIRTKNPRIMRSVEAPWPHPRIIDRIVEDASGQYIYASTVLKFVGKASRYCDPQEQLRILTTPGPHRARAFSDLDKLYATVLAAYPRPQTLICVLAGLLMNASLTIIRVCLGIDETEMVLVLDALSSLINVSESDIEKEFLQLMEPIFGSPLEDDEITFCHLSFREFLEDESRSGKYFVDVQMYRQLIGRKLLDIIGDNLKGRYEIEPHAKHRIGLSMFNRTMRSLCGHITACREDDLITSLSDINRKIQEFLPIGPIQFPGCLMRDMEYLDNATQSVLYAQPRPGRRLSSIASELRKTTELALCSARNVLSDSDQFVLTPTLVRIDVCRHSNSDTGKMSLHQLFNDTSDSVEATLSSLRMHRHIIDAESSLHSGEWFSDLKLFGISLSSSIEFYRDETRGWLSREEWDNAYVLVFYQYLKALFDKRNEGGSNFRQVHTLHTLLSSKNCLDFLSHVTFEEVFRRSQKVPIFELLMDTSAWMDLRSRIDTRDFTYMMEGIILWLHSEITNLDEREYIRRYDVNLLEKITRAMREIFEEVFPPEDLVPTPLLMDEYYTSRGYGSIEFLAPLEGQGEPVILKHTSTSNQKDTFERRHKLYQRLFGGIGTSTGEQALYAINTIYPRLAAFALRALVTHQTSFRLQTRTSTYIPEGRGDSSYMFPCLPYALPTHENLESLRALRYLDTNFPERSPWNPPAGFCIAISSVLKKFKPSDMSAAELEYFKIWLENLETLEIPLDKFNFQKSRYNTVS